MNNEEFDMFSFFELTPDLVCIAGKDGYFRKVNNAVVQKFGYSKDELFARPIADFMHDDDRDYTAQQRAKLLEGNALINFENRYVSKSGATIWLQWTSIYIPDKEVVFALAKDITEKKQVEKDIEEKYNRFKGLVTHFKTNIEKERKYFAYELHEEVAQLASAIKMDINLIKNDRTISDFTKSRIENADIVSQLLINKIKDISFSISPNTLQSLGLNETLKWLCKDFSAENNIPCTFTDKYDENFLIQEVKLDIFRLCQEALKNIKLHAKATSVEVIIEDTGEEICLLIIDNGIGFIAQEQNKTSGLINMRELANSINGSFEISSEKSKGTKVRVTIPK